MSQRQNKCQNMPLEDFGVSQDCLEAMKRVGFRTVDDLVDFFERAWGQGRPGLLRSQFIRNVPEMVNRLKAIGWWPDQLEDINID